MQGDNICKYFGGKRESTSSLGHYQFKCGTNSYLAYKTSEAREKTIRTQCMDCKIQCRAYCFRRLEELGFTPQSFWHTVDMQLLLKMMTVTCENTDIDPDMLAVLNSFL